MIRRKLLGLVLAGLATPPLSAVAATPAATETAETAADKPVAELNQTLLAVMKAGPATPFPSRFELLAPVVDRVFDLPGILRACVGPRWTALAPADQTELLEVFRRFTVASYVANFDNYAGERFEVLPESRASGGNEVVETRIVSAGGGVIRLDYVMRRVDSSWKAVDVLLDGSISRVAVQRSDFRGLLGEGADASGLIASLQRKVADLSHGTLTPG